MTEAENALQFIDSHDRDTWIKVGMSLKEAHGDAAFSIWDSWSSTASNYNSTVAKVQWKSFKHGKGITAATLFYLAREAGWLPDRKYIPPTPEQLESRRREAETRQTAEGKLIAQAQAKAAQKARWILKNTVLEPHAYLNSHGMKDDLGLVWYPSPETNLLVIPMRVGKEIVGVQLIDRDGNKKFLRDQRCDMAEFVIGNGKIDLYCEGYCTAIAVFKAAAAIKISVSVHACFSDSNLVKLAKSGFVIADLEPSGAGRKAAEATGLPYWISDKVPKYDFCDLFVTQGLFKTSQILRKLLATKQSSSYNVV